MQPGQTPPVSKVCHSWPHLQVQRSLAVGHHLHLGQRILGPRTPVPSRSPSRISTSSRGIVVTAIAIPTLALLQFFTISSTALAAQTAILDSGTRGNTGPAAQAILYAPSGLAEDALGNIYIAKTGGNAIRRVLVDGTIETFAGNLNAPTALLFAPDGALLYFDNKYCVIRKIQADRTIVDIAGSGACAVKTTGGFGAGADKDGKALETIAGLRQSGFAGDSGLATDKTLYSPIGPRAECLRICGTR